MEQFISYLIIIFFFLIIIMEAWKTIHRFIGKVLEKQSWNVIESEDYYRNIPFDNDLDIIYFVCKKAKYISNYTFVPAYLAKMIYDDKLKYIPNNKNFILDFSNFTKYQNNDSINEFYDFIVPYIENNIISDNKLSKILENNYQKIKEIDENICNRGKEKLIDLKLLKYDHKFNVYLATEELNKKEIEIKGFIKFIKDFSTLEERKIIEVKLWNDYMIIAALTGTKDAFDDDLKLLYTGLKIETFYENAGKVANAISKLLSSSNN